MTRRNQYANNIMIIYLLIGCLFQADRGAAAEESVTEALLQSDGTGTGTGAGGATSAVSTAAGKAAEAASSAYSTLIKETSATAADFGSETTKAAEQVIKAGGRASLAFGNLCNQLFGGLSATVATGTGYLASGVSTVDGMLGGVPVVRVVVGGLNNLMSGVSSTISEMTVNGRQSRQKMFLDLREKLNQSDGGSAAATTAAATTTTAANAGAGAGAKASGTAGATVAAAADETASASAE